MKSIIRLTVLLTASLFICFSAHAITICESPLPPSCISPHWGSISPDSDDPIADAGAISAEARSATAAATSTPAARAHIQLAQLRKPTRSSHTPKLLIDDVRRFDRQTRVLVLAIERATFDRKGNLKTGEENIERAVGTLREASKDHQLNLYIKVPVKLRDRESEILRAKVHSVNEVIARAGSGYSSPKQAPSS